MIDEILVDLKNVSFASKEMIIKKKKVTMSFLLTIFKEMQYSKKTLLNYVLIFGLSVSPGWLQIKFKNKIGKRKDYLLKVQYKDLLMFPKEILSRIDIT